MVIPNRPLTHTGNWLTRERSLGNACGTDSTHYTPFDPTFCASASQRSTPDSPEYLKYSVNFSPEGAANVQEGATSEDILIRSDKVPVYNGQTTPSPSGGCSSNTSNDIQDNNYCNTDAGISGRFSQWSFPTSYNQSNGITSFNESKQKPETESPTFSDSSNSGNRLTCDNLSKRLSVEGMEYAEISANVSQRELGNFFKERGANVQGATSEDNVISSDEVPFCNGQTTPSPLAGCSSNTWNDIQDNNYSNDDAGILRSTSQCSFPTSYNQCEGMTSFNVSKQKPETESPTFSDSSNSGNWFTCDNLSIRQSVGEIKFQDIPANFSQRALRIYDKERVSSSPSESSPSSSPESSSSSSPESSSSTSPNGSYSGESRNQEEGNRFMELPPEDRSSAWSTFFIDNLNFSDSPAYKTLMEEAERVRVRPSTKIDYLVAPHNVDSDIENLVLPRTHQGNSLPNRNVYRDSLGDMPDDVMLLSDFLGTVAPSQNELLDQPFTSDVSKKTHCLDKFNKGELGTLDESISSDSDIATQLSQILEDTLFSEPQTFDDYLFTQPEFYHMFETADSFDPAITLTERDRQRESSATFDEIPSSSILNTNYKIKQEDKADWLGTISTSTERDTPIQADSSTSDWKSHGTASSCFAKTKIKQEEDGMETDKTQYHEDKNDTEQSNIPNYKEAVIALEIKQEEVKPRYNNQWGDHTYFLPSDCYAVPTPAEIANIEELSDGQPRDPDEDSDIDDDPVIAKRWDVFLRPEAANNRLPKFCYKESKIRGKRGPTDPPFPDDDEDDSEYSSDHANFSEDGDDDKDLLDYLNTEEDDTNNLDHSDNSSDDSDVGEDTNNYTVFRNYLNKGNSQAGAVSAKVTGSVNRALTTGGYWSNPRLSTPSTSRKRVQPEPTYGSRKRARTDPNTHTNAYGSNHTLSTRAYGSAPATPEAGYDGCGDYFKRENPGHGMANNSLAGAVHGRGITNYLHAEAGGKTTKPRTTTKATTARSKTNGYPQRKDNKRTYGNSPYGNIAGGCGTQADHYRTRSESTDEDVDVEGLVSTHNSPTDTQSKQLLKTLSPSEIEALNKLDPVPQPKRRGRPPKNQAKASQTMPVPLPIGNPNQRYISLNSPMTGTQRSMKNADSNDKSRKVAQCSKDENVMSSEEQKRNKHNEAEKNRRKHQTDLIESLNMVYRRAEEAGYSAEKCRMIEAFFKRNGNNSTVAIRKAKQPPSKLNYEDKREKHNKAEKERRKNLAAAYETLRNAVDPLCVPQLTKEKVKKLSRREILTRVVVQIRIYLAQITRGWEGNR